MLGNFQYMVVCQHVTASKATHEHTIHNLATQLITGPGGVCEFYVFVAALVDPSMAGKRVEVRRHVPAGQSPTTICLVAELPKKDRVGPWFYGQVASVRPDESGVVTLSAIDIDGAFGPPETILSTYRFFVNIRPQ